MAHDRAHAGDAQPFNPFLPTPAPYHPAAAGAGGGAVGGADGVGATDIVYPGYGSSAGGSGPGLYPRPRYMPRGHRPATQAQGLGLYDQEVQLYREPSSYPPHGIETFRIGGTAPTGADALQPHYRNATWAGLALAGAKFYAKTTDMSFLKAFLALFTVRPITEFTDNKDTWISFESLGGGENARPFVDRDKSTINHIRMNVEQTDFEMQSRVISADFSKQELWMNARSHSRNRIAKALDAAMHFGVAVTAFPAIAQLTGASRPFYDKTSPSHTLFAMGGWLRSTINSARMGAGASSVLMDFMRNAEGDVGLEGGRVTMLLPQNTTVDMLRALAADAFQQGGQRLADDVHSGGREALVRHRERSTIYSSNNVFGTAVADSDPTVHAFTGGGVSVVGLSQEGASDYKTTLVYGDTTLAEADDKPSPAREDVMQEVTMGPDLLRAAFLNVNVDADGDVIGVSFEAYKKMAAAINRLKPTDGTIGDTLAAIRKRGATPGDAKIPLVDPDTRALFPLCAQVTGDNTAVADVTLSAPEKLSDIMTDAMIRAYTRQLDAALDRFGKATAPRRTRAAATPAAATAAGPAGTTGAAGSGGGGGGRGGPGGQTTIIAAIRTLIAEKGEADLVQLITRILQVKNGGLPLPLHVAIVRPHQEVMGGAALVSRPGSNECYASPNPYWNGGGGVPGIGAYTQEMKDWSLMSETFVMRQASKIRVPPNANHVFPLVRLQGQEHRAGFGLRLLTPKHYATPGSWAAALATVADGAAFLTPFGQRVRHVSITGSIDPSFLPRTISKTDREAVSREAGAGIAEFRAFYLVGRAATIMAAAGEIIPREAYDVAEARRAWRAVCLRAYRPVVHVHKGNPLDPTRTEFFTLRDELLNIARNSYNYNKPDLTAADRRAADAAIARGGPGAWRLLAESNTALAPVCFPEFTCAPHTRGGPERPICVDGKGWLPGDLCDRYFEQSVQPDTCHPCQRVDELYAKSATGVL